MQNSNQSTIVAGIIALVVIVGGLVYVSVMPSAPSKLDGFAQCLKKSGTVFYGAFWCSHCQNQKAMFGSAKQYLPYVECSTPDGQGQTQICKDTGIHGYPTWSFPDMSTTSGEVALSILAEKSGCALPADK